MTMQQAILKALFNVDGCAHLEEALLMDVNILRARPRASLSELRAKLATLEAARLVVGLTPRDPEQGMKWMLTDTGRAEHLANQ